MTAVEWLNIEFQKIFPKETSEMYNNNQFAYEDMILKDNKMFEQQIINAFSEGAHDGYDGWYDGYGDENKEKYYNETYKK
jgi:hypothetical protein